MFNRIEYLNKKIQEKLVEFSQTDSLQQVTNLMFEIEDLEKELRLNYFRDGEILERLFFNRVSDIEKKILENRVRRGYYKGRYEKKRNVADYITITVNEQPDHFEIKYFNFDYFCGFGSESTRVIEK